MQLIQKQANQFVPVVSLATELIPVDGVASTSTYRGVEVSTIVSPTYTKRFTAIPERLGLITVAENANIDASAYPVITAAEGFTGVTNIRFDNDYAGFVVRADFASVSDTTVKTSTGITGPSYLQYSSDWLFALLDQGGDSAVYSGDQRNPSCWGATMDLTGIPYSNSNGAGQKNSALLTRRHLAGVNHFPIPVGTTVTFKKQDGSNIQRRVIGSSPEHTGTAKDAKMYVLNADVDDDIAVYPVVGRWVCVESEGDAVFNIAAQHCGIFINQDRDLSFVHTAGYEGYQIAERSTTIGGVAVTGLIDEIAVNHILTSQRPLEFTPYEDFRIQPRPGDSGSAVLVPVVGGLAFLSVFSSQLGGPFFDEAFANALILSADNDAVLRGSLAAPTGYTVTVAADPVPTPT